MSERRPIPVTCLVVSCGLLSQKVLAMMRVMLIVMGCYLVSCYAYGVYLLIKVYTGKRMNRRSVAMSHDNANFVLRDTSESAHATAAKHNDDTQSDQAKAA